MVGGKGERNGEKTAAKMSLPVYKVMFFLYFFLNMALKGNNPLWLLPAATAIVCLAFKPFPAMAVRSHFQCLTTQLPARGARWERSWRSRWSQMQMIQGEATHTQAVWLSAEGFCCRRQLHADLNQWLSSCDGGWFLFCGLLGRWLHWCQLVDHWHAFCRSVVQFAHPSDESVGMLCLQE